MSGIRVAASSGTPEQVQRGYLTIGKLPNPMAAMCPDCKCLARCQGTVKVDGYTVQNRRCEKCGRNIRLYIRTP